MKTGKEVNVAVHSYIDNLLNLSASRQFVLSILAGCFVTFGAQLSIHLSTGIEQKGVQLVLFGLGFVFGFSFVILTGSALFTSINFQIPMFSWQDKSQNRSGSVLRLWLIAFVGNFLGTLITSTMMMGAGTVQGAFLDRAGEIILKKIPEKTIFHWFQIVLSAILANWLVAIATYNCSVADNLSEKVMGLLFPVLSFAILGFQHSVANMAYMCIGIVNGLDLTVFDAVFFNLVPAALGNMIGAIVLVSFPLFYIYTFTKCPENPTKETVEV